MDRNALNIRIHRHVITLDASLLPIKYSIGREGKNPTFSHRNLQASQFQ